MSDGTHIEWTDATWNPITGCSVVSPGCANCYAMKLAGTRLKDIPSRQGLTRASKAGPVWTGEVRLNEEWLDQPLRWSRPRRIFVCAHGDLFHESVPDEWIDRVFAVMALAPQHTFQVLTKRTDRLRRYLGEPGSHRVRARFAAIHSAARRIGGEMPSAFWFMQHIWLGFSAEDQPRFNARWADMKHVTRFGPRWASLEPLLGPIDLQVSHDWCDLCGGTGMLARWPKGRCHVCRGKGRVAIMGPPERHFYPALDWVVVGGESGPGARPMHPDWARSLRDQCAEAGVPFLFKQWGAYKPAQPVYWEDDPIAADAFVKANYGPDEKVEDWDLSAADAVDYLKDFPDLGVLYRNGYFYDGAEFQPTPGRAAGCWWMERVGKKAAGRLLDGVLHDGFPQGGAS